MFSPQSTPSKRPKRRVESYRIYKRPYSACSQSSRPSPSSYEKATHGRLVGPTLSTPRGDNNYNQYRPLCEVCPRDCDKVVGTLQGIQHLIELFNYPVTISDNMCLLIFYVFVLSCVCYVCARLFICALWSPAGKGLTSWLSFVVSSVSLSLSHWYPGSGVVLDCIDT